MLAGASVVGVICAIVTGFFVGILSAMFGIGGGVIMVPVIRIFFDRAASMASATALLAIVPTTLMGIIARRKDDTIRYGYGILIGAGGACFSPVGAYMSTHLPGWIAMMATAVLVVYTAYKQFKKAGVFGATRADASLLQEELHPLPIREQVTLHNALICVPIGAMAGIASGFIGVGGGFVIVPLLCALLHLTIKEATGTSLIAMGILVIPGVISHALYGNVDYLLGLLFVIGALPGAEIGANFVKKFSNQRLVFFFGCVLVLAGVMLAIKELL